LDGGFPVANQEAATVAEKLLEQVFLRFSIQVKIDYRDLPTTEQLEPPHTICKMMGLWKV